MNNLLFVSYTSFYLIFIIYLEPKQSYNNQESNSFDIVLIIVFTIFGGVLLVMAVFLGRKIKEERVKFFLFFIYLNYAIIKSDAFFND
jgi:hypothetical protein